MRLPRVNELLRQELSRHLHTHHAEETVWITITDVQVSADLSTARVFYTALGGEARRLQARSWFQEHAAGLRHHLARTVELRQMPLLRFQYDEAVDRGHRVLQLLDEIEGRPAPGTAGVVPPPAPPTEERSTS